MKKIEGNFRHNLVDKEERLNNLKRDIHFNGGKEECQYMFSESNFWIFLHEENVEKYIFFMECHEIFSDISVTEV